MALDLVYYMSDYKYRRNRRNVPLIPIPNDTLNIFNYVTIVERSERQHIVDNLKKVHKLDTITRGTLCSTAGSRLRDVRELNIQDSERRNIRDAIETYIVDYIDIYLNEHFRTYKPTMKQKLKSMFFNNFRSIAQENGLNRIINNIRRPEPIRNIEQPTVDFQRQIIDPIYVQRNQELQNDDDDDDSDANNIYPI
jgi:hypothetical protein